MNLSQIRVALDDAGVRPAKKLGQNFLHDQNLARWIVEQAQISRDDFVLEIGPGLGALTSEILKRGARLLALEKDAHDEAIPTHAVGGDEIAEDLHAIGQVKG